MLHLVLFLKEKQNWSSVNALLMDSMLLGQPCVFLNCFAFGKTNLWKYIWHKPDQEKSAAKQLAAVSSQAGVHPSHDFKPFWKIIEESKQSYVGSTTVLCDHMYFRPSFLEGLSAKVVYISQVPLLLFQKWMFPNFWSSGNQKLNGHTQAIGLLKNLERPSRVPMDIIILWARSGFWRI